ncbi:hypothetical protein, partial [Sphaerisporangium melleum]
VNRRRDIFTPRESWRERDLAPRARTRLEPGRGHWTPAGIACPADAGRKCRRAAAPSLIMDIRLPKARATVRMALARWPLPAWGLTAKETSDQRHHLFMRLKFLAKLD